MKNRFSVAIAMIALTVSLAQARGQEWFGRWGTNDATIQIVKAQINKIIGHQIAKPRKTASASLLPDRLPIGDEMTLRVWDVSTNSIQMSIWLQIYFHRYQHISSIGLIPDRLMILIPEALLYHIQNVYHALRFHRILYHISF